MNNFIFGYGSLISSDSRSKTGKSGVAIPVKVRGLKRSWNFADPDFGMTAIGVVYEANAICNGVMVSVPESELVKYDEREIGYDRIKVNSSDVVTYKDINILPGTIWVYVLQKEMFPSEDVPITQSYIDVIISGCLEFGEDFAKEFINTTEGWNVPWINDRSNPIYLRPINNPSIDIIDKILKEVVPDASRNRK